MLTEKSLKVILLVLLLFSIIVYTLLTDISTYFLKQYFAQNSTLLNANILSAIKIVSAIASIFTILFTIKSKYISKLILGEKYVSGKYEGTSYKINEKQEVIAEHKEYIEIQQSLISTIVTGVSREKNDQSGHANLNGSLVKYENKKFLFLVEIETPHSTYLEVISMNFINDNIHGFISASSSNNPAKWKFTLKKIVDK